MRSTFFAFNIARSGLNTSQRHLDVTGHNIANVNTPGYTRQRQNVAASSPLKIPNAQGMIGTGVTSQSITQMRSQYLDFKFRNENSSLGQWEIKRDELMEIEAIFNEPSDTGIREVLDQFYSSFQELSKNPESLTVRALVRQRGISLAKTLNHMHTQLDKMQKNLDLNIHTTVGQVNSYAEQISKLNRQIFSLELDGTNANDLRDQRNLLLDELSKIADIQVYEDHNKKMNVSIGGIQLVSHFEYSTLYKDPTVANSPVVWNGTTYPVGVRNGSLYGLLELRDGATSDFKGVPYYMDKLDRFVETLGEAINTAHRQGTGLDGSTGVDFFEPASLASAATIRINELMNQNTGLNLIAAALVPAGADPEDYLPGDGSNALEIIKLRYKSIFGEGAADDFMKSLISNLGVDTQEAFRMAHNQTGLVYQVDNKRQSISGVSLDEEMANMIKFQHSYNASARMITTIDEMIDVIVNRMGLVGR